MRRQSLLDAYFKTNKAGMSSPLPKSILHADQVKNVRKRILSLRKSVTPSKSPRVDGCNESDIIDLCSDDDYSATPIIRCTPLSKIKISNHDANLLTLTKSSANENSEPANDSKKKDGMYSIVSTPLKDNSVYQSDSSQDTVIYSPQILHRTPEKHSSPEFKSPQSGNKYFSPNKKRVVLKRPTVRKKLIQQLDKSSGADNNDLFLKACEGVDDKTVFLLDIINKCILDSSLLELLHESSQCLLAKCMQVVKPGMALVCRLYWYKPGWYKLDKIRSILSGNNKTIEDPTLHAALRSLEDCRLLTLGGSHDHSLTFEEYATILSADELSQICKELKLKTSSKKEAITSLRLYSRTKSISNFFTGNGNDNSTRLLKIMKKKVGPCYKLSDLARSSIYELYILMYLGMNYDIIRDKKLELTLLYDKINRETYPIEDHMIDNASVVITSRVEFASYVNAHIVHEEYLEECDVSRKCDIVKDVFNSFKNIDDHEILRIKSLPGWLRRFTPAYLYIRILEAGIQDLKSVMDYALALEVIQTLINQDLCRQNKRADLYAEKALILHKQGQSEEAAKVLLEGFKTDLSEEVKDAMRPRAKIIANLKRLDLDADIKDELLKHADKDSILESSLPAKHIYKQPMDRTNNKGKLKFQTRKGGERTVQDVEDYCLEEYISSGEFTDGIHCEGKLVNTIFFLLFWDIIYWKPPGCVGIFLSKFQRFPFDLFSDSFYANRRESIEARLTLIESSTVEHLLEIMEEKWKSRPEGEQSGMSTGGLSWDQVRCAATCLGPAGAGPVCRRLARSYAYAHSGFPDLTLWNVHTKQIRFVEVKSDTDKPSLKQIQWMKYLREHGVDTEFCYVGVNTTRNKARSRT